MESKDNSFNLILLTNHYSELHLSVTLDGLIGYLK